MSIRSTHVTIDLNALDHNLALIKSLIPQTNYCAVIKANAYGHGALPVAQRLIQNGITWLAVALIEEGMALRRSGIKIPILVLGPDLKHGITELLEFNLTPVVFDCGQLRQLAALRLERSLSLHLKVDTGMNRLGLCPNELQTAITLLQNAAHLQLDGIMTHLACADSPQKNFTSLQLQLFRQLCGELKDHHLTPQWVHAANSAAAMQYPEARFNLVRLGLILFGVDPLHQRLLPSPKPLMRWVTRPMQIKDIPTGAKVSYGGLWQAQRPSRIGILPVGYADGYPRCIAGKAQVLIRGQRAPIIGNICMDLCMVDLTDIANPTEQDEIVLLGNQQQQNITPVDFASWAETLSYEIMCSIGPRVIRQYITEEHTRDSCHRLGASG